MEPGKLVWPLIVLLLLPIVSGVEPEFFFARGEPADLNFACFEANGQFCDTNYNCTLTVQYPNSTILLSDANATRQTRYYNVTIPNTRQIGVYAYQAYCTNGTNFGFGEELYYEVNVSGEEMTVSKGLLYLVILGLTTGLFSLCFYFFVKLPWRNTTMEDGLVNINDLKYLKLFLGFMVYILALFISFLAEGVASFLQVGVASSLFNLTTALLVAFIFPVFVFVIITGFINFFSDKNLKKLKIRNLKPR